LTEFFSTLFLSGLSIAAVHAAPGVGDAAPDFKMTGSDGKEYSLAQFKGRQAVVIAWYPLAFTKG
jgi:peroxiredoxin Q/BCP